MAYEQAIIIRNKTRLEQLIERFTTKEQARFYLSRSGLDFNVYEEEHNAFYRSLDTLQESLQVFKKQRDLDRSFLSNYIFTKQDLIFVLGQDGLVANTAKYVNAQPIVGVNPDPQRYDGLLLPFNTDMIRKKADALSEGRFASSGVTMAKAQFSDGQSMLAFNDFFIGPRTHTSARYILHHHKRAEQQSSSGILVSTGAGSTGWMSSVFNMVNKVSSHYSCEQDHISEQLEWDTDRLLFAVREPFKSKTSSLDLTFGEIREGNELLVESQMAESGVVFSDGIESDAIKFTTGMSVTVSVAKEKANLVVE